MPEASLPKTYDPAGTEARWQAAWEESGAFHPDPAAPGAPFAVVIPPPNVTGSLHMGHAFNTALIDTVVRFQRLRGNNVLCLPGTDHASIAVQTILEKKIQAEGGSKDDLGRDAFLERAWAWKAESGGTIVSIRAVLKAWPMCRLPVTFGGGITTENGSPGASGSGWNAPASSHSRCQRASVPAGS